MGEYWRKAEAITMSRWERAKVREWAEAGRLTDDGRLKVAFNIPKSDYGDDRVIAAGLASLVGAMMRPRTVEFERYCFDKQARSAHTKGACRKNLRS